MAQVFKKDITVSGGSFNAIEDRVIQSSAISNSKYAKNNKFMIFDSESKLKVTASSTDLTIGIGKAILCGCLFDNDVVATLVPSRPISSTAKAYLCITIDLNGTTGQKQFFEDVLGDVSNFPVLQKDDLTEVTGIKNQVALASYTIDSNGFITNFVDMTANFIGEGSDALPLTGGNVTGDINMQGNQITEAHMGLIQQRNNFIRITLDPPNFTPAVANEKFKIRLPVINYGCELRIKAVAAYSYLNTTGLLEKTINFKAETIGVIHSQTSSYTNVEGEVAKYLSIEGLYWNSDDNCYEITISKLATGTNVGGLTLILEFEGAYIPNLEQIKQISFSEIYTTDPWMPPTPVLQTRGNEIWHAGNAGIIVNDRIIGYDDSIYATTLIEDILKDVFVKSQAIVGNDKSFELNFLIGTSSTSYSPNFGGKIIEFINAKYGTFQPINSLMKFQMNVSSANGMNNLAYANCNKCSIWGTNFYFEWEFDYDNWAKVIVRDAAGGTNPYEFLTTSHETDSEEIYNNPDGASYSPFTLIDSVNNFSSISVRVTMGTAGVIRVHEKLPVTSLSLLYMSNIPYNISSNELYYSNLAFQTDPSGKNVSLAGSSDYYVAYHMVVSGVGSYIYIEECGILDIRGNGRIYPLGTTHSNRIIDGKIHRVTTLPNGEEKITLLPNPIFNNSIENQK